jgi:hypothetical protein
MALLSLCQWPLALGTPGSSSTLWCVQKVNALKICHGLIDEIGDVLRVSPNELSFANVDALKAIYGSQKGASITKSEFYDMIGLGFDVGSLGSERHPAVASQKRELFAEAFSDRNLVKQEPTMQKHVDLFVEKIYQLGNTEVGMKMDKWLTYLSFDLTGMMAFGESFLCLEKGCKVLFPLSLL